MTWVLAPSSEPRYSLPTAEEQHLGQLAPPAWPSPGATIGLLNDLGWAIIFGPGTSDDTARFQAAESQAGAGGTIIVSPGTFTLNNWTPTQSGITVRGAGMGQTILKAKAAATAAVTISAIARTTWQGITFDGNSLASDGLDITGATLASSLHLFIACQFQNALVGCSVLNGSPTNEADQDTFVGCYFTACTTGFKDVSGNGQDQTFVQPRFNSCTTGINLGGAATLSMYSGQITGHTTGILFSGTNGSSSWVLLDGCEFEGASGAGTTDIDGTAAWPTRGVTMRAGILQGGKSNGVGKTVILPAGPAVLRCIGTAFVFGDLSGNAANNTFEDTDCSFTSGATVTLSTTSRRITVNGQTTAMKLQYLAANVTMQTFDFQNNAITMGASATTLGFYGTSPIARQVLATGTGKTVDNVITALQNLGLVSQV